MPHYRVAADLDERLEPDVVSPPTLPRNLLLELLLSFYPTSGEAFGDQSAAMTDAPLTRMDVKIRRLAS